MHAYNGKNTDYKFLADNLVAHGYYVISIQHELPGDEPIAMTGNLYHARYPNWERGVQTIRFVLQELAQRQPQLDWQHVLLMGHSNGGDMVMLLAKEHPELRQVQQLISFDNRRVPFPRRPYPRVLSLRVGAASATRPHERALISLLSQGPAAESPPAEYL